MTGSDFRKVLPEERILENVPMKEHTTFRVGGPARIYLVPETREEILGIFGLLREEKENYFVLGRGSNLIVGDKGFDGVIIDFRKGFNRIENKETVIWAEAGAMMSDMAKVALNNALTGFEFASGIPGTIGGGIMMNAGAYGGEIKDVLKSAEVLLPDGEIRVMTCEELGLGYRYSRLPELSAVVLSVEITLTPGNPEDIKALMDDLNGRRRDKQPLEYASAGSTFKRPTGYFAGALIEGAGLKGYAVGDAEVSTKHAGFVINKGNATAADILAVIRHEQEAVYEKYGVMLEPEDKMIGEF